MERLERSIQRSLGEYERLLATRQFTDLPPLAEAILALTKAFERTERMRQEKEEADG